MYEIRCKRTKRFTVYGIPKTTWNAEFANKTFSFDIPDHSIPTVKIGYSRLYLPSLTHWKDSDVLKHALINSVEYWEVHEKYKRRVL